MRELALRMAKLSEGWTSEIVRCLCSPVTTLQCTSPSIAGFSDPYDTALLVYNSVALTLAWLLSLCSGDNSPPVSLTNGGLLPEVIKPEDIMFE